MPDRDRLSESARVFFALWPDSATRAALARETERLHGQFGGRPTRATTLHLTLVFIGAVPRERLDDLVDAACSIQAGAFDVNFDRIGCWRHNKVAWIAPTQIPERLGALVSDLERALAECGIDFDRRDYRPHVTLARKAECRAVPPAEMDCAIRWPAREFVLVESRLSAVGAGYEVVARFPLAD